MCVTLGHNLYRSKVCQFATVDDMTFRRNSFALKSHPLSSTLDASSESMMMPETCNRVPWIECG